MTSSTLISPSGQGPSSTPKTFDYLLARAPPGARVASKERARRHPLAYDFPFPRCLEKSL